MKQHTFLVIVGILLAALVVTPLLAQDATPEPVGLRPDAPTYALHGPYWVGTMQFEAETYSHRTNVLVQYPALNPQGIVKTNTYLFRISSGSAAPVLGHAITIAAPDTRHRPYPLIIWAHGWETNNVMSVFLGEHLASYGFVVVSINYADNSETAGTVERYSTLYSRLRDVTWQLDQIAIWTRDNGTLAGMIDAEHVAVVGYSHGGYTALGAGGARLDFSVLHQQVNEPEICVLRPEAGGGNVCADLLNHQPELADLAGLNAMPEEVWPNWGDSRIDAVVALAPPGRFFGFNGLQSLSLPAMLLVGSLDQWVSPEIDVYQPYDYIGSKQKSLVVLEGGNHFIFMGDCEAIPWAIDAGLFWGCSDPVWDMDRAHDLINHFTTAFLLDTLKGDRAAHAALLAENVSFPGITYETTMK